MLVPFYFLPTRLPSLSLSLLLSAPCPLASCGQGAPSPSQGSLGWLLLTQFFVASGVCGLSFPSDPGAPRDGLRLLEAAGISVAYHFPGLLGRSSLSVGAVGSNRVICVFFSLTLVIIMPQLTVASSHSKQ